MHRRVKKWHILCKNCKECVKKGTEIWRKIIESHVIFDSIINSVHVPLFIAYINPLFGQNTCLGAKHWNKGKQKI